MMADIQSEQTFAVQTPLPFPTTRLKSKAEFPETKYMGSKQALLPFIAKHVGALRFDRALDAFSGSGCVAYALKQLGAEVHANDFLKFAFHIARGTVENNSILLTGTEVKKLLIRNPNAGDFVQTTFGSRYFRPEDNRFLDNLWANMRELRNDAKRSLVLAAACRAAMKKRPRGIFTFTGTKGWDGRRDLRLSMEEQFISAAAQFNAAVFSNKRRNKAHCNDIFDVDPKGYDLVYVDPPYVSHFSDCDYTRRYHFVEGFCTYWKGVEILEDTLTRKIRSYPTDFSSKVGAAAAFAKLFNHFRNSILVVSYSSNGIPSEGEMVKLLKEHKRKVEVHKAPHKYSHGNHNHKVGDNNNSVQEYLFIAE
jgi:DNA adenine methylase